MVKRVVVFDYSFLVFWVSAIDVLDDLLLQLGRRHVFLNWSDYLY